MPKFTIAWLAVYFGGLIASVINPLYGLLAYLFEYYLRPSLHWWGKDLPAFRWSLLAAVVTAGSFVMNRTSLRKMPTVKNPALPWVLGLGAVTVLFTPLAANVAESWEWALDFLKLIALYGLMVGVVRTQGAFDAVLALHIACAGWWGWEAYLDPTRVAGRLLRVGSSDTLNDNAASAHLLTVIPFLVILAGTSKDKRLRALAILTAPFIINTFVLCNSRGSTLGLIAILLWSFRVARAGLRIRIAGAAIATALAFVLLADPVFFSRQQTTATYEEDPSATGRLESWIGGLKLLRDRPWGAGGRGFHELSPKYIPHIVEVHEGQLRAPHNTFVMVATEWGVQGLVLFLGFLWATFRILKRVRIRALEADWFYYRALGVELALVGQMVAGTFTDRLYGESVYWMAALAFALCRMQEAELPASATETAHRATSPKVGLPLLEPASSRVRREVTR